MAALNIELLQALALQMEQNRLERALARGQLRVVDMTQAYEGADGPASYMDEGSSSDQRGRETAATSTVDTESTHRFTSSDSNVERSWEERVPTPTPKAPPPHLGTEAWPRAAWLTAGRPKPPPPLRDPPPLPGGR